jgi:hypothetical protein
VNRNWRPAKSAGSWGEQKTKAALERAGCTVRRIPGREQYDLEILTAPDGWPTGRCEVKRDKRQAETGNVAIEIERNGRPSGLAVTAAVVWAIVLHGEILLVPAATLRQLVADPWYRRVSAGDKRRTVVCLVPTMRLRMVATHVLEARSRRPKNGPAWKANGSTPADRRQACNHQWRDISTPDGRIRTNCTLCGQLRDIRSGAAPRDRRQQSLFDGGAKW